MYQSRFKLILRIIIYNNNKHVSSSSNRFSKNAVNIVKYFQLLQFDVTFERLLEYFYILNFCGKSDLIKVTEYI